MPWLDLSSGFVCFISGVLSGVAVKGMLNLYKARRKRLESPGTAERICGKMNRLEEMYRKAGYECSLLSALESLNNKASRDLYWAIHDFGEQAEFEATRSPNWDRLAYLYSRAEVERSLDAWFASPESQFKLHTGETNADHS